VSSFQFEIFKNTQNQFLVLGICVEKWKTVFHINAIDIVFAKIIPIYDNYRYSISGLNTGYEGGQTQPGSVSKVLSAVFNPADFLYNVFGKRPAQMRKLRQMKNDDNIRNLLSSKFDRETLMAVLQLEKVDIDEILNNCNYSETFIRSANDLQILDAMSECYEEYRVLNRRKN